MPGEFCDDAELDERIRRSLRLLRGVRDQLRDLTKVIHAHGTGALRPSPILIDDIDAIDDSTRLAIDLLSGHPR